MARLLALIALCLHVLLASAAGDLVAIPPLKARVTDLTATLPADQRGELESKLAALEAKKGSQVVVLLLPSTEPESIEQFGIRLFDTWKVGRKGIDDGVILIVAKEDRRLRIEVGYGLEGALNDATAKRIIDEIMTPKFKTGGLPGGITAGVDAILAVVDGEQLPPAQAGARSATNGLGAFGELGESTLVIILGIAAVIGAALRHFHGNLLGAGVVSGLTAGLGWFLTGSLAGVLIAAIVGFFVALFGLDLLLSGVLSGGRGGGGNGGFGGGGGMGGGGGASGRW